MGTIVYTTSDMVKAKLVHAFLIKSGLSCKLSEVYENMGTSVNMAFASYRSFSVFVDKKDIEQAQLALKECDSIHFAV